MSSCIPQRWPDLPQQMVPVYRAVLESKRKAGMYADYLFGGSLFCLVSSYHTPGAMGWAYATGGAVLACTTIACALNYMEHSDCYRNMDKYHFHDLTDVDDLNERIATARRFALYVPIIASGFLHAGCPATFYRSLGWSSAPGWACVALHTAVQLKRIYDMKKEKREE